MKFKYFCMEKNLKQSQKANKKLGKFSTYVTDIESSFLL